MKSITFFLCFVPILALVLLILNLVFAPHSPYQEKSSTFECGFHSFLGQNRTQFSISFFIYALLFLLFDLELLVIYPYVVSSYDNSGYGLVIMLIFFCALTAGFAFELGKNALAIDSRQTTINSNILVKQKLLQSNVLFIILDLLFRKHKFIYDIVRFYFKKFSLIESIIKAIEIRFIAFILNLIGIITYDQIFFITPIIIAVFMLYSFVNIPWRKKNMSRFIIFLTLNIMIATLFIYSLLFLLCSTTFLAIINRDVTEHILFFISLFTCLGFEAFTDEIIYINTPDEGPSGYSGTSGDSGPSGYSGTSGDSGQNGPSGPNGPPRPPGPEEPQGLEPQTGRSNKTKRRDKVREASEITHGHKKHEYVRSWLVSTRTKIDNNLDTRGIILLRQKKALQNGLTEHFKIEADEKRKNNIEFQWMMLELKKNGLEAFDKKENVHRALNFLEKRVENVRAGKSTFLAMEYTKKKHFDLESKLSKVEGAKMLDDLKRTFNV